MLYILHSISEVFKNRMAINAYAADDFSYRRVVEKRRTTKQLNKT